MTPGALAACSTVPSQKTDTGTVQRGMEPLVVACAADEAYAMPLAVMLASLSTSAGGERTTEVYIVDCGISSEARRRIETLSRPNVRFHWRESIRPPGLGDRNWGHVSGATYDRLMLEEYVPAECPLVLWLDCDLLVLEDISSLQREIDVMKRVRHKHCLQLREVFEGSETPVPDACGPRRRRTGNG